MTDARVATLRAELRDDTAFVATPSPAAHLDRRIRRARLAAGSRRAERRRRDGDDRRPRERARRVAVRAARGRRGARHLGAGARGPQAARPRGATRCGSRRDSSPKANGSPSRSASPTRRARRSPRCVRTTFTLAAPVSRALLFWTALGVAEPEVNGAAVSDDILSPGWTSYRDRLVHETVDVTAPAPRGRERAGRDDRGRLVHREVRLLHLRRPPLRHQPSFLAQLRREFDDGTVQTLAPPATAGARRRRPRRRQRDLRRRASGPAPGPRRLVGARPPTTPRLGAGARRGRRAPGYENVPVPEARIAPPVRRIQTLPVADVLDIALGRDDPRLRPEPRRTPARARRRAGRHRASRCGTPRCSRRRARHSGRCATRRRRTLRPRRRRRRDVGAAVHVPRLPLCRDRRLAGRVRPAGRRGGRAAHRHDAHGLVRVLRSAVNRLHENVVWGMRGNFLSCRPTARSATSVSAGRATSRSSRRGVLPVRLRRLPRHLAARPRARADATTATCRSSFPPRSGSAAGRRRPRGAMPRPSCRG